LAFHATYKVVVSPAINLLQMREGTMEDPWEDPAMQKLVAKGSLVLYEAGDFLPFGFVSKAISSSVLQR